MDFLSSISNGFCNYVTFRGRACRSEYWYWVLFLVLLGIVTSILDTAIFGIQVLDRGSVSPLNAIVSLLTFLPSWAVGVRRLHDVDRTGWWMLIVLTVIGVVLLFYWSVKRGTWGPNRYGPDPLEGKVLP